MIKIIATSLLKGFPIILKSLFLGFTNFFEFIARSIDSIGYHILQPLRTIRFEPVRDFLSENLTQILLVIVSLIIIFMIFNKEEKKIWTK